MRKMIVVALFCAHVLLPKAQEVDTLAIIDAYNHYVDSVENTFHYQYGEIVLGDGLATMQIPKGYKYLGPEQSKTVLSDLWGNPPSESLGMLFLENTSPLSENMTYAVEITYEEDGFVDDDDAEDIDYDDLLEEIQGDSKSMNEERAKLGYEPIEMIGWASTPYYDSETKKLHWAKELKFGEAEVNTLNYNIRVLGRKGYLVLNAIGDINVLPEFEKDKENIIACVEFNDGYRYSDFNPKMDKVAAYGIGGLVAGKLLAKAGFFAIILKFWKVVAVGAVGLFASLRKKIFRGE